MRSERGFNNHFSADLPLEELELGVVGEALCTMYGFFLNVEHLVSNDERLATVAPLDDFRVAFNL